MATTTLFELNVILFSVIQNFIIRVVLPTEACRSNCMPSTRDFFLITFCSVVVYYFFVIIVVANASSFWLLGQLLF